MIDLHAHSTISDGMDSPAEVVRKAKRLGLKAVTLTDHDCIDGLKEAEAEAKNLAITFIKGIELSVSYGKNRIIHILGLGINPEEENFKKTYLTYRQSRHDQIGFIIKCINGMGRYPKMSQLNEISTDGFIDRQTIAKWLFRNNYTKSMQSSWVDYIDKFPEIDGELMDMATALNMIKSAGGKSFLAHYHKPIGLKGYSNEECDRILTELKSLGLDGMERYYPDYTELNHNELDAYIQKYDFIASGGSDYHGSNRPEIELGFGNGSLCVPDGILNKICI